MDMNPYWVMREDLLAFKQYTFPRYQISGHHQKLANALEAVERGDIKRLRISTPHQRGKTELAIVGFVPWVLGKHPDWPIILISFGDIPVERFSRRSLDVIRGDRFKNVFPEVKLSGRSQSVAIWEIDGNTGGVRAAGIGGAVNSFPCRGLIIDDSFKSHEEAQSETQRDKVWEFYQSIAYSRLAPDGWIINIGTRQHDDDLHGRLEELEKQGGDKWEKVHVRAINDDDIAVDTLVDLYKKNGEEWINREYGHLVECWPERWQLSKYLDARINVGSLLWETQFQGRPSAPEGTLFKRKWFSISPRAPEDLKWIRIWDIAVSEKNSADFTVGTKMAVDATKTLWIGDVVRGQWSWPEARRRMVQTAEQDGPEVQVFAERPAYGGKIAGYNVARDLTDNWERIDIPLRLVDPVGDIVAALNPAAARAEAGRVVLVQGPWNTAWIDEICGIPYTKHDDQGASLGLGFRQLSRHPIGVLSEQRKAPTRSIRGLNQLASRYENRGF